MWSRRIVKVLGAVVVVTIAVGAVIGFINSSRDASAAARAARAEYRRAIAACERGEFGLPGENTEGFDRSQACRDAVGPFEAPDPRWHYTDLSDVLLGTGAPFAILCLVLGASFIGAEWQKGTVTTALTWEPRRIRLLGAKFAAVAASCFLLVVALQLVVAGALWPVAALRGSTAGLDAAWLRETVGIGFRIAAVGGLAAIAGCAIATVGRNTAAAVGVAFVYFAVLEGLIRGFRPRWQPWLLGDNAAQFLAGQPVGAAMADKTMFDVALALVLYGAALVALATLFFTRRDIT